MEQRWVGWWVGWVGWVGRSGVVVTVALVVGLVLLDLAAFVLGVVIAVVEEWR